MSDIVIPVDDIVIPVDEIRRKIYGPEWDAVNAHAKYGGRRSGKSYAAGMIKFMEAYGINDAEKYFEQKGDKK